MAEGLTTEQIQALVGQVNERITRIQHSWTIYAKQEAELGTLDEIGEEISHLITFRQGLLVAIGEANPIIEYLSSVSFRGRKEIEFIQTEVGDKERSN